MSYSKKITHLNQFRPLKDFEDQLDEIFERAQRNISKNRNSRRRNVSSLKSKTDFFIESDSREIDDEDVLTIPVREKVNATMNTNCVV